MATKDARNELFNEIEANRAAQVNAELEAAGSEERVEFKPTPNMARASGKDATDGQGDRELDDADLDGGEDGGAAAGTVAAAAAAASTPAKDAPIYEFLGEDKLDSTRVKVKINGVEQEVAVADLVRTHQKSGAADQRLREANEATTRANQIIQDANEEAARIRAAATGSKAGDAVDGDGASTGATDLSDGDGLQQAMGLMYEGSQEEAAKLLDAEINRRVQAAIKSSAGTIPDSASLAEEIREQLTWDQELSNFTRDNKDIVADPELARMFQRNLNDAAKTSTTPAEAIEKASAAVKGWLTKVSGRAPGDAGDGDKGLQLDAAALRQRQADKTNKQVRSNTNIRSQSQDTAETEYNPSAVVAEMKKARGQ